MTDNETLGAAPDDEAAGAALDARTEALDYLIAQGITAPEFAELLAGILPCRLEADAAHAESILYHAETLRAGGMTAGDYEQEDARQAGEQE